MPISKKELLNMVENLYDNYSTNNIYSLSRLEHHIHSLPSLIENETSKNNERISKFNELTNEQELFSKLFLTQNKFYYTSYNNKYYEYNGLNYCIIDEDIIQHKLLTSITTNQALFQWKHKTKLNIIKKIKNISLFSSIPGTSTIQYILSFLKLLLMSDEESIYFLCILGDCILKKNNNLLYFIKPNAKYFISAIDYIIYTTLGYSISNNFIVKYHNTHEMNNYRLIKTKTMSSISLLKNTINNIGLDLMCVATYYSDFYGNSENYILKLDESISNYILYFIKNTADQIIDNFILNYIEIEDDSDSSFNTSSNVISWKNMHYIWKIYLHNMKIPTFLYTNALQQLLNSKLSNELSTNNEIYFKNITSKYLPNVSSFLAFWNENIIINSNKSNSECECECDYDYEIIEILQLCKNSNHKTGNLNSKSLLRLINHYFCPNVEIIDDKYIKNIKCTLWNKENEINDFLNSYKYNCLKKYNCNLNDSISIDKLYDIYKKQIVDKNFIISHDYFKKYTCSQLQNYMKSDNLIDFKWVEM
jgi:hypothetical protein